MVSSSSNGVGGTRPAGSVTIPGRARTVTSGPRHAPDMPEREDGPPDARPERQWINLDGRSFDLTAPRGTYVNILV